MRTIACCICGTMGWVNLVRNMVREVEEFTDVVHADGVVFHAITYQELIVRLAEHRAEHPGYVTYMTERYL